MSGIVMQRTAKQKEADALDLGVFRCISRLLQFADDHKDKDVREAGIALGGVRRTHPQAHARR